MKVKIHRMLLAWSALAIWCHVLTACGGRNTFDITDEVEIAPGKWLSLKEEQGTCRFELQWHGKTVRWEGKRNTHDELELPVTLREFEGTLYLITFNREDLNAVDFAFYRLQDPGPAFVPIPAESFPKSIATENMELGPRTRYTGTLAGPVDTWELTRKLDVEHRYFFVTRTRDIWLSLETGKNFSAVQDFDHERAKQIVREYYRKYKPVPLPTLVREGEK
jgi:hypothetical protein